MRARAPRCLWGATTRRAKPRLKRTLIRPFGPPSPWKGEGPERKENRKTFPPQGGRWRRSRRMRGRLETGKRSKPISLPCRKKKRFLESKEKGAPVRVRWLQIVIRRPVFTPPPSTSTGHSLRRRNRERLWFYPTFFRRLRRWGSGRGAAAWCSFCCRGGYQPPDAPARDRPILWGATTRRAHRGSAGPVIVGRGFPDAPDKTFPPQGGRWHLRSK